jgi:hypothetical protein
VPSYSLVSIAILAWNEAPISGIVDVNILTSSAVPSYSLVSIAILAWNEAPISGIVDVNILTLSAAPISDIVAAVILAASAVPFLGVAGGVVDVNPIPVLSPTLSSCAVDVADYGAVDVVAR